LTQFDAFVVGAKTGVVEKEINEHQLNGTGLPDGLLSNPKSQFG
jgi:hypothetical protein